MRSESLRRVLIGVCGAAAVCAMGGPAAGQQGGTGSGAAAAAPAASLSAARASREVARMAALDLQLTGGTNPRDFRIAALLLEIAHQLAPDDENILRLLIDAVSSSGDRAMLMATTTELVRRNPADTVAQLRLISGGISSKQDSDSRLEAYERFLNFTDKNGNKLDASIRSRLALDAALLLRERGDLRGFADKLALAAELDATNKDAASLAVAFFSEQSDDPVGRLALLINLLKADPFDPATHIAIARQLAAGDAVEQASRFYDTYGGVLRSRFENLDPEIAAESATVLWSKEGAETLVRRMREEVEQARSAAEVQRRQAIEADKPLSEIPNPERVRLSPELERVRLAAALALGDDGQTDYAYVELARTYELQLQAAQDRSNQPEGTTEQMILDRVLRLRAELMWMQLFSGRQVARAEATLAEFKEDPSVAGRPEAAPILGRLDGWLQLQKGDLDGAERTLTPLAGSDLLARAGLCVIKERRGEKDEALKAYAALAHEGAGSVAGVFARTRYGVLAGTPLERGPAAKEMEALARAIPDWLEQMIADPRRIVALQATLDTAVINATDPVKLRIRMRNVSPIPLAVGPEKPINSRVLIIPRMEAARDPVRAASGSVVVRMDRRLRLLPQEEIEVEAWADQGNMGWIMNRLITVPVTVRWKVIQGFVLLPQGIYAPGPQSVAVETQELQRRPTPKSLDDPPTLVRWLETGTSEDVAEVIMLAQINAQAPEGSPGVWTPEEREAIANALAARYAKLDVPSRLMVAALLPARPQAPWLRPVEEAMLSDADPRVQMVALTLRAPDPKDPRLAAAQASSDARLAELALLLQDRLEDGTGCYATVVGKEREPAAGEQSE